MPRGGPRPNSGGRRLGAGRKSKSTLEYQAKMRDIFAEIVTADEWSKVVQVALDFAKAGNKDARAWLTPWVIGAEPKEVKLTGDEAAPLVVVMDL